jgi:ABC-type sugar transport system ATPase subunit
MRVGIEHLTVRYGALIAVDDLSLDIADGELIALVGPSGCGKTTTLGFIAGFARAERGRLSFDGNDVTALPPRRRGIGYVFQDYAIYPHMTVAENIRFPLDVAPTAPADPRKAVQDIAELVGVSDLLSRRPHQLSGGQRQRVALARALVKRPGVLLLDEPLSNLDAHLRVQTRAEIRRLQLELGMTTILVTHDQSEALAIADRVAVMSAGRIVALAAPGAIYDRPSSLWDLAEDGAAFARDASAGAFPAPQRSAARTVVGVRPEHVKLDPAGFAGTVVLIETLGKDILLHLDVSASKVRALVTPDVALGLHPGAPVNVSVRKDDWHLFDADTGARLGSRDGATTHAVHGERR